MGFRRKSREFALQMLFELEFNRDDPKWRESFWKTHPTEPAVQEFSDLLTLGVLQNQKSIDDLIRKHAEHWTLERMNRVDRNILRLAIHELLSMEGVPVRVVINEAIEIAKRYGDEASGAFVNGILDHIVKQEESILISKGRD
jgi:N utilization substance protein B